MDAVARGPHDLRHIQPDGIESWSGKRSAIACARDGNLAFLRHEPGLRDNLGRPVGIAPPRRGKRGMAVLDVLVVLLEMEASSWRNGEGGRRHGEVVPPGRPAAH